MTHDLSRSETSEDRLRTFARWVADHKLIDGIYSDAAHPYREWVTPEGTEQDFVEVHERAKEALGDA